MNQILDVDDNNNKKEKIKKQKMPKMRSSAPLEISSILKFFGVAIFVFGICMIGTGSYSMYQDSTKASKANKPEIYIEQRAETEIMLKVAHDKEIATITYQWNDKEEMRSTNQRKKRSRNYHSNTNRNQHTKSLCQRYQWTRD